MYGKHDDKKYRLIDKYRFSDFKKADAPDRTNKLLGYLNPWSAHKNSDKKYKIK